jgi:hypothetical protein
MEKLAREIDVTADPQGEPLRESEGSTDAQDEDLDSTDLRSDQLQKSAGSLSSSDEIDVLVLYTPAVDQAVGNILNTSILAVSQLNSAYVNSGISSSEVSVHRNATLPLDFDETDDITDDLFTLRSNTNAQDLRDEKRADLVILLTDGDYPNNELGVAFIDGRNSYAYALVEADRATANYTFAHEVGHLQGGRHQQCYIYNRTGCDNSSDYGHGYSWTDFKARDLFRCASTRISPEWSLHVSA